MLFVMKVCFCGKSGLVSPVHKHPPTYYEPSNSIPHTYILAFKINFNVYPVTDETRERVFLSSAPFCPVKHCLAWFENSHLCYWGFRPSGMWCCEAAFVFPNFRLNLVSLSSNHPVTRRHVTEDLNLRALLCVKFPRFRSLVLPARLLRRRRVWSVDGMMLTGRARSATFPTTNLTWSGPGLKLNLGGERPGNNLISQSTTFDICWSE
jgi:hypothetical protein